MAAGRTEVDRIVVDRTEAVRTVEAGAFVEHNPSCCKCLGTMVGRFYLP